MGTTTQSKRRYEDLMGNQYATERENGKWVVVRTSPTGRRTVIASPAFSGGKKRVERALDQFARLRAYREVGGAG